MIRKQLGLFIVIAGLLILAACGGGGGKNIAIGPPASETNSASRLVLEAYGIEDSDYSAYQEGFSDAADGVQDGNIDVTFGVLGLPAGSVENLQAQSGDVKLLGLSDDAIAYIEENSGYERFTIPEDTYEFMDSSVETVTAYALMMGNTDTISEELGYELARIMVEHADENTHAQSQHITLENALNGSEGLPIHPGAKRYYEEQGFTVDNPVAELNVSEDKTDYVLGTGSQGGTYYPLGGEIATIWGNHIDEITITNTETGASIENLVGIRDGDLDLGLAVHVPSNNAVNGEGDFEGEQVENVAFIGHVYPEVLQVITRESTGIESLDDILE